MHTEHCPNWSVVRIINFAPTIRPRVFQPHLAAWQNFTKLPRAGPTQALPAPRPSSVSIAGRNQSTPVCLTPSSRPSCQTRAHNQAPYSIHPATPLTLCRFGQTAHLLVFSVQAADDAAWRRVGRAPALCARCPCRPSGAILGGDELRMGLCVRSKERGLSVLGLCSWSVGTRKEAWPHPSCQKPQVWSAHPYLMLVSECR